MTCTYIKLTVRTFHDIGHTRVEMVLASVLDDAFADILDNHRKSVASYVRMGIYEYRLICTETYELIKDFTDVSPL